MTDPELTEARERLAAAIRRVLALPPEPSPTLREAWPQLEAENAQLRRDLAMALREMGEAEPNKHSPWCNGVEPTRSREGDILILRTSEPRLAPLTDEQIGRLWSWFSDDTRCAGWLILNHGYIQDFRQWAFLSPFETVRGAKP